MKPQPLKYKALLISVIISVVTLSLFLYASDATSWTSAVKRLVLPLMRLIGVICLGLLAGQAIESLGWTRQFAILARPFFNFSRVGNHCSAAFTSAFISGAVANAMLWEFYEDNKISKLQLFLSNYLNQFPAFFLHLPTTMFIVLPLTGRAGALYFLLTFLATLLRTGLCLFVGRMAIPEPKDDHEFKVSDLPIQRNHKFKALYDKIRKTLPSRLINILIWILPIYTFVFVLGVAGFFDWLNLALSQHISVNFIPVESLSVIILSFAAEFTSGFAAAGALLSAGMLSVKQTVIALLLGNILAFPIRALRHQLPRYMGIFTPKLGLQLLLSGQIFRVLSLIVIGILYYMVS